MNYYKGLISLPGLSLGRTRNSRNARTTRPPWRRTFGTEGMISKPEIMFQTKAKILKMLITVSSHWGHVNSVIDIGFNITAFLLPTHHAKFRHYRNVEKCVLESVFGCDHISSERLYKVPQPINNQTRRH